MSDDRPPYEGAAPLNPYEPPLADLATDPAAGPRPVRRVRPLAIFLGLMSDWGSSLVGGVIVGTVLVVLAIAGAGDAEAGMAEFESWQESDWLYWLSIAIGLATTFLGGLVTGLLARGTERLNAIILGVLSAMLGLTLVTLLALTELEAGRWTDFTLTPVMTLLAALAGGEVIRVWRG